MWTVRDLNVTQESIRSSEAKDWHTFKTQEAKATPPDLFIADNLDQACSNDRGLGGME
jgi:hypothetical protein